MKKYYLLVMLCALQLASFANPTNNSVPTTGNWNNISTWSLNRLPIDGDTVVIPAGRTVTITDIQNYSTQNLFLKIYGTLDIINGKLWLGANSTIVIFTGGVLTASGSPSETVKIGGDVKFEGTQGSLTGPAIANGSTGSSPTGFTPFPEIPLPVKFIAFNVARQNADVLVQWATAEEYNNQYFEVERSIDGSNWTAIATVGGAGNTSAIQSYTYTDKNATAKVLYYRIRQVDVDGKSSLTSVRMVKNELGSADIKISSSPSNAVYVHFSQKLNANIVVRMVTACGQLVSQQSLNNPVGQVLVPVSGNLKGIFIVTVTDGRGLQVSKQVLL